MAACLCHDHPPRAVRTRVVLVLHRTEAWKTTNSGRLLGAVLDDVMLHVHGARDVVPTPVLPQGRRLVLFPKAGARILTAADARGPEPVVLVVPDGTWSQAARMVLREPVLRDAECVCLPTLPPTRYDLRRNAESGRVCTYEAVMEALAILEGEAVRDVLEPPFQRFLDVGRQVRAGLDVGSRPDASGPRPGAAR